MKVIINLIADGLKTRNFGNRNCLHLNNSIQHYRCKINDLNKVIGGENDTDTCQTDYSSSGGNPDCISDEYRDVIVISAEFDTPIIKFNPPATI